MKIWAACFLLSPLPLAAQTRAWSDGKGGQVQADYISSTDQSVTVKRAPDGQVFRFLLKEVSDEDRAYVAAKQAEEKEANMIVVPVRGEIAFRLPGWNSLGWSNNQDSELWLWDEKEGKPSEKVATIPVIYDSSLKRNEFFGTFATKGPVKVPKTGKLVVRAQFKASVNGNDKSIAEFSQPIVIPTVQNGVMDLRTVRLSLKR